MSNNQEKKLTESRNLSIKEGIFAHIKTSLGYSYISPFAIAINASNSLIAYLHSIPGLLGPFVQLLSSRLVEKHSRKSILLKTILFEILAWIPIIAIAILYYLNILVNFLPLALLLFFSLYIIANSMGHVAWFSWLGDIISEKNRGKWFGKRSFIFSTVTLIASISAAVLLDWFKANNLTMFGFITLFSLAMLSRIISWAYLKKQYEPKLKLKKGYYFSFWDFIKESPKRNFGRFAIFRLLMSLSVTIAGPFFTVYMLRTLNYSYLTYIIIISSQTIFSLLSVRAWGKFADRYGNYEILKLTSILIALYPFLWLFSDSPIYLIFVPQLIAGIAWSGFLLASGNFIYDSVSPQKRNIAYSYYEMFRGAGVFLGASIGALLVKQINITFMNEFLLIFLISGVARTLVSLIMIPLIKEVRDTEKFDSSRAFQDMILKKIHMPNMGSALEIRPRKKHFNK
jgi:MFS family permease